MAIDLGEPSATLIKKHILNMRREVSTVVVSSVQIDIIYD
jgi:hypothetical protein